MELLLWDRPHGYVTAPEPLPAINPMLPACFPAELREASSLIRLQVGERLFSPDAPPLACYRVLKGKVALLRPAADGA
jgi:CRP-like cAMP-binding protein